MSKRDDEIGKLWHDRYKVDVPEGISGDWRIERFVVSEEDAKWTQLRAVVTRGRDRPVPAGTYTRLMCGGTVVMSDTVAEVEDHLFFIAEAKGRVLINGLGLGMVLNATLNHGNVEHATVVEVSPDVIALVGDHYARKFPDQVTIVNADARKWKPPRGVHYGHVWHDIWPTRCADDNRERANLRARYRKFCDWQGCWK